MMVAMNDGSLKYILTDHLGSTSAVVDQNGNLLGQQRYLPFGEERTGLNPPYMTQTDLTYTGQRDLPGTGVMDYDARFYSPSLGRFLQADTIVSNAANPQDLNRFSYVNNRSIIMNDPSGHTSSISRQSVRPIADPIKKPSCVKNPSSNEKGNMNRYSISSDDYKVTYTAASIGVQNPNVNRWWNPKALWNKYSGRGPAKITNAEMDTPYGDPIIDKNGDERGYGLGLNTQGSYLNQSNWDVAFSAMSTRIQVRLDACENVKFPCTPTDIFIASALGGDAAISPGVVQNLGNGIKKYGQPNSETGIYQWGSYLDSIDPENSDHNKKVLQQFVNNTWYLKSKGAAIPEIEWEYVCSLLD
jgi:RHS repeat-associated protein